MNRALAHGECRPFGSATIKTLPLTMRDARINVRTHMRSLINLPVIYCLVAALLFGASTPVAKRLLSSFGPFTLAGLLYLGAAIATLPLAFHGGSAELRRDPRQRRMVLLAVLFGGGVGPVLLLLGLRTASAASVSIWLNLETVATTLLAWALFHEHLDRRTVLAVVVVLLAGVLLAAPSGASGLISGCLIGLACVCWGLDNNLTALVSGFTPAQTTVVKGVLAGAVNLAIGIFVEGSPAVGAMMLVALVVGALSYGASILLYILGAQQLGASRSQVLFSTSPFLGMLLSWLLLGEPILAVQVGAAVLMIVGVMLMLSARHAHDHTHEAMTHTHSHRHDDGHHTHVHPGLPAWRRHTHPHEHEPITHHHPHSPDLHHRHRHKSG